MTRAWHDRLQKILEHVPGFIYTYEETADGRRRFPYVSAGVVEIYGMTPEEAQRDAETAFRVIHPDDVEDVAASIAQSKADLSLWHATYRVQVPGRSEAWVEGRARPERRANGDTVWHGFIYDVTERRLAELRAEAHQRQLEELEARFRLARESARIGVFEYQPATDTLIWDDGMFSLFGVEPAEFEGCFADWSQRLAPEDLAAIQEPISEVLAGRRREVPRFRIVRPDGEVRWIRGTVNAVTNAQGVVERLVGLNIDETDNVAAEAAMQKAMQTAVAADQAKTAFLANMSHELRTPLNAVSGFAEMLGQFATQPDRVEEYAGLIHNSAVHLTALVDRTLDMARIETDQFDVRSVSVAPRQVADSAAAMVRDLAQRSGIHLEMDIPHEGPRIVTDPDLLRQAILNLLSNAIKFSGPGEIVSVTICCPSEGGMRFEVRDRGPGIPDALRPRLFTPFVHDQSAYTNPQTGVGLGLAITRRIADALDIGVSLEDRAGGGTVATLSVPESALPTTSARHSKV